MYMNFIFLLKISILIVGCGHKSDTNGIDLRRNDDVSIYDFFTNVKIIPLETTEESLITEVSKVQFYNGHYYILDRRSHELFCFDEEGKFLYKISNQGRGPREYVGVSDFTIDRFNYRLLLLDPATKHIHSFDIEGNYLNVMNLEGPVVTRIHSLNDSTLVFFSSVDEYELLYYSMVNEHFFHKEFKSPGEHRSYYPSLNGVYQFENRTFFLPSLSRNVYDLTDIKPKKQYTLCFGELNNTNMQIARLITERQNRHPQDPLYINDAVGKKNILNYHIYWAFETSLFIIAFLEFDNDFKHVFINKENNESYVFTNFNENIVLRNPDFGKEKIILYDKNFIYSRADRNLAHYNKKSLPLEDQNIIANHNPETDNPFLVVYELRN